MRTFLLKNDRSSTLRLLGTFYGAVATLCLSDATAANLLFYYWPNLMQHFRRGSNFEANFGPTWIPPTCQNPECNSNSGMPGEAIKVCLDHTISLAHHPEVPPPSFYCNDCYTTLIRKSNSAKVHELFEDIVHPVSRNGNSNTCC